MNRTSARPTGPAVATLLAVLAAGLISTATRAQAPRAEPADDIHVLPVGGNVSMLVGAGGNITVSTGDDGVLLVDSGLSQQSAAVLAAIRRLSTKPIRYIVNTHVHPDHTGGNDAIGAAGFTLAGLAGSLTPGASIVGQDTVLERMSAAGNQPPIPSGAWPSLTFPKKKELYFNGEAIQIVHQPRAHTDGDAIVFFRKSDVVSAGDIFLTTSYPIVDVSRGGTIQGVIDGLNTIIDLAIAKNGEEGGTQIVPGHGRLSEESDVVEYRDMTVIIRDRIEDMAKKGMTLEQVKAAKPTFEYDGRYGATTGFWTTEKFVEAVYQTLRKGGQR